MWNTVSNPVLNTVLKSMRGTPPAHVLWFSSRSAWFNFFFFIFQLFQRARPIIVNWIFRSVITTITLLTLHPLARSANRVGEVKKKRNIIFLNNILQLVWRNWRESYWVEYYIFWNNILKNNILFGRGEFRRILDRNENASDLRRSGKSTDRPTPFHRTTRQKRWGWLITQL